MSTADWGVTCLSSDVILDFKSFAGLNTASKVTPSEAGEAVYTDNFLLTDELKLKKRGGFRPLCADTYEGRPLQAVKGTVTGINPPEFYLLTTAGLYAYQPAGKIYRLMVGFEEPVAGGVLFERDGLIYCLAGGSYFTLAGDTPSEVQGYVPLITLDKKPDGSVWTPFEEPNLLNRAVRESFTADGSALYVMKYRDISDVSVTVDGETVTGFNLNGAGGKLTFTEPPASGSIVEVRYSKDADCNREEITRLTGGMFYGGENDVELFLWGNGNSRYMTEGGKPDYFPLNNHTYVGDGAPIIDMVRSYDRQVIFTADAIYYSTAALTPDGLRVRFPVYQLNSETGIDSSSGAVVADNRPVFPSGSRIYELVNTASRDEKNIRELGQPVRELLRGAAVRTYYIRSRSEVWFVTGGFSVIYSTKTGRFMSFMSFSPENILEPDGRVYFAMPDKRLYVYDETAAFDVDGEGNIRPFSAVYRMEGLDFGAPYSLKRLKEAFAVLGTGGCEKLRVKIRADGIDRGHEAEFFSGCMDFSDLHFSALSFVRTRGSMRRRLAGDRFLRLGVTLTDDDIDSRLHLEELTLPARLLDRSV